mmetsp:Transcript_13263/g.48294  ORF Transcript_13263/g.48294 Transcript_13263/m.48294 type:complete len:849 (-) Transcript_13263:118-2664(-)
MAAPGPRDDSSTSSQLNADARTFQPSVGKQLNQPLPSQTPPAGGCIAVVTQEPGDADTGNERVKGKTKSRAKAKEKMAAKGRSKKKAKETGEAETSVSSAPVFSHRDQEPGSSKGVACTSTGQPQPRNPKSKSKPQDKRPSLPPAHAQAAPQQPQTQDHHPSRQHHKRTPAASTEQTSRNRGSRGRGRGRGLARGRTGKKEWWRDLSSDLTDPITLEPLRDLGYAPFEMEASGGVIHRYDGRMLANYLVSSGDFTQPISRKELTRDECIRLDNYIRMWKLGNASVTEAFDNRDVYYRVDGREDAAQRVERLREEAEALLLNLYGQPPQPRQLRTPQLPARAVMPDRETLQATQRDLRAMHSATEMHRRLGEEGSGWTVHDDDLGMLPELETVGQGSVVRDGAEDFPSLGGASRSQAAAYAPSTHDGGAWVATPWGRQVPAARRDFPSLPSQQQQQRAVQQDTPDVNMAGEAATNSSWVLGGLVAKSSGGRDGTGTPSTSATSTTTHAERRRKQLAEAFGINEREHASMFATSNAEAFTNAHLEFARSNSLFVQSLERQLENFVLCSDARRISLEIMPRIHREIVHVVCKHYGLTTQSYGSEPRRHVDIFRTQSSSMPSIRLSDAAKAPVAYNVTVPKPTVYEMRFSDVVDPYDVMSALRDWSGQFQVEWNREERGIGSARHRLDRPMISCVVTFSELRAFHEATEALGAGTRGRFRISHVDPCVSNIVLNKRGSETDELSTLEWRGSCGKARQEKSKLGDKGKEKALDEWGDEVSSPHVRWGTEGPRDLVQEGGAEGNADNWEALAEPSFGVVGGRPKLGPQSSGGPGEGTRYLSNENLWSLLNTDDE